MPHGPLNRKKTRTSISIPEQMLRALDRRASEEGRTRSDLVCEAVNRYFCGEQERLLAEGYMEMAEESLETMNELGEAWLGRWPEW